MNYISIVATTMFALIAGVIPDMVRADSVEFNVQISDPYGILDGSQLTILIEGLESASRQRLFATELAHSPPQTTLNISQENFSDLSNNPLCFRLVNNDNYDLGRMILRSPCQIPNADRRFSLTLRKPVDYGFDFRRRVDAAISRRSMTLDEFSDLHEAYVVFFENQPKENIVLADVRLFAKLVTFIDNEAPHIQDPRFFALDVFDNPLSTTSSSEYFSQKIFDFLETELGDDEEISIEFERAVAELYFAYQGIRPFRFTDPGPVDSSEVFYRELFGLVLALDVLKPGGFELARVPPIQRYSEKCLELGTANPLERDRCLLPLFENLDQIDLASHRESVRRTVASKIAQSFDCQTLDDVNSSYVTDTIEALTADGVCTADFDQCSSAVRQCMEEID